MLIVAPTVTGTGRAGQLLLMTNGTTTLSASANLVAGNAHAEAVLRRRVGAARRRRIERTTDGQTGHGDRITEPPRNR